MCRWKARRGIWPRVRDEVHRIAGEALRNAFRHAQARRIEVEIRYDHGSFGCGSGTTERALTRRSFGRRAAGHFGLPGMRERAKSWAGNWRSGAGPIPARRSS